MHVLAIPFYVQLTQGFVQQDIKKHLRYTGDFLTNFQFSQNRRAILELFKYKSEYSIL